ncbi:MAG: hypothetical protein LBQ27_01425 [Clostridiales bacterium]|jgi:hypothetical protein|nr:hypothetical protein [Clostridiales bacterium]
MKKRITLLALVLVVVLSMTVLSSCALIVAGDYKGGNSSNAEITVVAEGAFKFSFDGKVTYKGKDSKGNDIDFSGTYKVEIKDKIYIAYIEGKDATTNENTFSGVYTYFEGRKQILVYWDGNDADAYVYKR